MSPEIRQLLENWKQEKFYAFEERSYKIAPNPNMQKEFFIELVHTAKIWIGKRSYPFKSKKRFITFTQYNEENPDSGNITRLRWAMQELGKKFDGKVIKNLDIIYRYYKKELSNKPKESGSI